MHYVVNGRAPFIAKLHSCFAKGRPVVIKWINPSSLFVYDIGVMLSRTFVGSEPFTSRLVTTYPDNPLPQIMS